MTDSPSRQNADKTEPVTYSPLYREIGKADELFTSKDIETAKKFAADAEKLLGKLDIDGKPGVSRSEIITGEHKKIIAGQEMKTLFGLSNMEPSVQEAWQVPDHRWHLQESVDAQFYKNCGSLLKNRDSDWAKKLTDEGNLLDKKSQDELASDRKKQVDVYFNKQGVTPQTLKDLKEQISHVEQAQATMKNAGSIAGGLLKRIDPDHNLTLGGLEKMVSANDKRLSTADKKVCQQIINQAQYEEANTLITPKYAAEKLKESANESLRADRSNKEQLFVRAVEGYNGKGLGNLSETRLGRELDFKDGSQRFDYERANNMRRIPADPVAENNARHAQFEKMKLRNGN